jgi:uncharacterized membrane protein
MKSKELNRLTGTAILFAIVVALQIVASFVKFGPFVITLALVPIIVGAAMYGPRTGAVLGGAFGAVVLIMCINGVDLGGHMLWQSRPVMTAVLCLFKGAAAGWVSGMVYAALAKRNLYAGTFCAAFACPVVNTGIFLTAMTLLYRDILTMWAGDTPLLYFTIIGLTGVNFLIELGVVIVLAPTIVKVIQIGRKE